MSSLQAGPIPFRPWVTRVIIAINVAIFVLDYFILRNARALVDPHTRQLLISPLPPIAWWCYFSRFTVFYEHQYWRFVTCAFVHGNVMHILVNMMGLLFAGPIVEERLGRVRFILFYALCAIAGPVMHVLLTTHGWLVGNDLTPLLGASAAIYGTLVAAAMLSPREIVDIAFPPMEVQLWKLVLALVALAILNILWHLSNAGGEAGHLGGAIVGFVLVWVWKKTHR